MQLIARQEPDRDVAAVDSVMGALMTLGRLMRRRLPGDVLEPPIFWMLKTLAATGSMRVTDLAIATQLDTSTVSRHVGQLERSGLLVREPDPEDRRAQRVGLTEVGWDTLRAGLHRRRAVLLKSLQSWDSADVTHLDRLLDRLVSDVATSDLEN